MRRIKFDDVTIQQIREYIEQGHSMRETCIKFGIKRDTLRRVIYEHGIQPYFYKKVAKNCLEGVTKETENLICSLFENTEAHLRDISKEAHIPYFILKEVLEKYYSQAEFDSRKSKLRAKSKIGKRNPMYGKYKELHHNYIGEVSDGKGYLMKLKPDWYTGRKGCKHVFSHHLEMCQALGLTQIPEGYCVHHIDRNKTNNDISNLCLLRLDAHSKLHSLENKLCKVQRLSKNRSRSNPKRRTPIAF